MSQRKGMIEDMNIQVAVLRDLLICVGKPQDSPEIRDKIKQTRKKCVDTCTSASQIILPEIRSDVTAGIPVDSQQLVNLVCCSQLLLRELRKCKHLISNNKMEMSHYYEQRQGSSGMSVLDKLVLWRPPPVNYHQDELHKIDRDAETVEKILEEMQEFMPHETNSGKALMEGVVINWRRRRKSAIYRHVGDICCVCKSNSS
ncbi:uncharacterized protein LOC111639821 isoform X1 [Centruroides sculpturatus]|uniref:uncharacterized protein LOC111639821 isoform X1 n=2 Tax=Centruroides sculpturatus TaxID=218467 RepID=UPI000C6D61F4|nr:uncharacterized protein LOC111639821 isoform X1 [Centruroides sculpturatus]XP_023241543.1 uncharacterized protein LOC111639821 isoform X1 [Centruroides sculpturatus]